MYLIIGGRGQGKLEYAMGISEPEVVVANLGACDFDEIFKADIIYNLHIGIRKMIEDGIDPVDKFGGSIDILMDKILIGDEIGSGIVPNDPAERKWRDETGRVYTLLSKHANKVDRIWAGCVQKLK
ncbi:MAG: bifunctional adenosylcobinamide kinase/adenosylcobinamide-phosphate guanylyltransferase [Clostridia bacterium]|nr:bifunctional adenosylcobinamide kinase/adenosylcobinamide-phosphate guanylyltransferase [Clostridia bacterium]